MTKAASVFDAISVAVDAARAVTADVSALRALDDSEFTRVHRMMVELQKQATTLTAIAAGEIAYRSRPELGKTGLAQRDGHRTPEMMVVATTGASKKDAAIWVAVDRIAHDATPIADPVSGELRPSAKPWLDAVGLAVSKGALPVAKANSIASGIGDPSPEIDVASLTSAVTILLSEASELDCDRLWRRARDLRDDIDESEVARRERHQREKRELYIARHIDGTAKLIWNMDTETAALVGELFDRATSPRRGGARVAFTDQGVSERIEGDSRTTGQLASDTFLQLLTAGADADTSQLLGTGGPDLRVVVREEDLLSRTGYGAIEGSNQRLSIATIERMVCEGRTTEIVKGIDGQPLDTGREHRLYNRRQRRALAARDGGCVFPGCDRPPSFTEAHHTKHWQRDRGRTDIADGVLLCKHHHLLVHNNGWEITRTGSQYWLIPPRTVDPAQSPRLLRSRSPIWEKTRPREIRA